MRGHVRKRGNTWTVVVDVGRDETGKRQQRWHGGFATRKEAERARVEILSQQANGDYIEPSKETLGHYLTATWLPAKRSSVRPTTFKAYGIHVRCHVLPRLGAVPLQKVTGAMLNKLYAELLAAGRADGSAGLKAGTVRKVHAVLSKALSDAVRWRLLARNPAAAADPPRLGGTRREMDFWTPTESERFLANAKEDELFALWRLYLATGMRRGEALALRWSDISLEGGTVVVARAYVSVGYKAEFTSTKSGRSRNVMIDATTVAALKGHRSRQLESWLAMGVVQTESGLVFSRPDGLPIHPDHVSKRFQRLVAQSGVKRIRLHDLRHTHGAQLAMAGVHPKVVQDRLGHQSITMTLDTYGHLFPSMQESASQAVASMLG